MAVTSWLDNGLENLLDIGVLEGPKAVKPDDVLVVVEGSCHALANGDKVHEGRDGLLAHFVLSFGHIEGVFLITVFGVFVSINVGVLASRPALIAPSLEGLKLDAECSAFFLIKVKSNFLSVSVS